MEKFDLVKVVPEAIKHIDDFKPEDASKCCILCLALAVLLDVGFTKAQSYSESVMKNGYRAEIKSKCVTIKLEKDKNASANDSSVVS